MSGNVTPMYNYTNIAAQTAGVALRTGRGVLHAIAFNKPIATSVLTVYDGTSTSGTKIATITIPASPNTPTLLYDVAFSTGLFVVMATADMDVTISWAPL
jgi:hypothetical protein